MVLLGHDFVRKRWSALALTGIVWGAAGVGIFIDALDGVLYFPLHLFGYLLLLEALILLLVPGPLRPCAERADWLFSCWGC
jgi:hypothetical protein